jgi:hypothetical protein
MSLILLVLLGCRPSAPLGYYDACSASGGDTGAECADGLECVALEYGDVCTLSCESDGDCPLTGSGRATHCTGAICVEDETND